MGNQQDGAPEGFQVILEPFDGFDVQVVGGLVQEQDVRTGEQDLRQFDAHVPSLAEGFRFPVQFILLESQAEERLFRLYPRRLPRFERQAVVDFIQPVN